MNNNLDVDIHLLRQGLGSEMLSAGAVRWSIRQGIWPSGLMIFDSYDFQIVSHSYSRSNAAEWLQLNSLLQQTDLKSKGTSLLIRAPLVC